MSAITAPAPEPPSTPTTPSTPATPPIRPKRSQNRLTATSIISASPADVDPLQTPPVPFSSSSPATSGSAQELPTPSTPQTPTPAYPTTQQRVANRKSTASIRRKPVPLCSEDLNLELANLQNGTPSGSASGLPSPVPASPYTPRTPASGSSLTLVPTTSRSEPPRYVLPVDPPAASPPSSPTRPPSYGGSRPEYTYGVEAGLGSGAPSLMEDLPTYAEETQTEPKTLAKALWKWGFLCPLLWLIGMCILWIPLKPIEEERDPEKAQKLEEMIVILRRTELKYARRCMWGFVGFGVVLAATIIIAVLIATR
ncbi:hypothetical protein IAT38_008271 [Cryptococcus sp. DSM 104549]